MAHFSSVTDGAVAKNAAVFMKQDEEWAGGNVVCLNHPSGHIEKKAAPDVRAGPIRADGQAAHVWPDRGGNVSFVRERIWLWVSRSADHSGRSAHPPRRFSHHETGAVRP